MAFRPLALLPLLAAACAPSQSGASAEPPAAAAAVDPYAITVDAAAGRRAIDPMIYGVNGASTETLEQLNLPLNRSGGNSVSMYNWRLDARAAGSSWFFESLKTDSSPWQRYGSDFVGLTKAAGAQPMLSVPMMDWQAKLAPDGDRLAGYSIARYGLQQETDTAGMAEAGNGIALDGRPIDNDPTDAAIPATLADRQAWVRSIVDRWGKASAGGVRYWLMDNEISRWHDIHRSVQKEGVRAAEVERRVRQYAAMVKAVDPGARIVAPEEWGWLGYHESGFDQQQGELKRDARPDRDQVQKGMAYVPWLLSRWKAAGRPIDVFSLHYYPQGGEYEHADDVSPAMQRLRNRSTRSLWDPAYKDPTWIADVVRLIPRMREWADTYYWPGTPIALTEYSWGADKHMNGATAQADILGIFGREGLDMAARWIAPEPGTPVWEAFRLYRNYDGRKSTFGETSVAAAAPDPDRVAAFAALRKKDGALTLMVVNKQIDAPAPLSFAIRNYAGAGRVEAVRLAGGRIAPLPAAAYAGGRLKATLPAQSVTLFVLHGAGR
ncbi:MAG: hypothetical protein PGN09_06775 [Sphingomonas fennica]